VATKKQLEQRIVQLETDLAAAHEAIAERDKRIVSLEERFARLEARLMTSSENSSLPPSKNPPHVKRGRTSGPSGNPPGGRPGHEPFTFSPVPDEAVGRTVKCPPASRCGYCTADLTDAPLVEDERVVSFDQLDLPPLALDVTRYHRRRRQCDHCRRWTLAELPAGVGPSPFGPGLLAFIAALTCRYRLGRRPVAQLLSELFGRRLSLGAIQGALESAGEALSAPVAELARAIDDSPVAGSDETGWRDQSGMAKGKHPWLWMATTPVGTVFSIAPDRGVAGSYGVLGEGFKGIVTCDRWRPYQSRFGNRRQLCWAHLARDATSAVDRGTILARLKDAKLVFRGEHLVAWGTAFGQCIDELFTLWHAFKKSELSRAQLRGAMTSLKMEVARLLVRGRRLDDPAVAATCRDLLRQFVCLWTFASVEGVEPTNNEAERELRPAVILRGLMNSTKSARGRLAFTRLMSASATCRKQGRNFLGYLKHALDAHARGLSPPSLLPA
jgi:transposase